MRNIPLIFQELATWPARRWLTAALVAVGTVLIVAIPTAMIKLVLLALGYTGAIQFFGPIQPYLAVGAIALLVWAFASRVLKENSCPLPASQPA